MTEQTHILRVNPLFLFEEAITADQFEENIETVIKGYSSTYLFKNIQKVGNEYRVYLQKPPEDKSELIAYIEEELPVDYAYWEF